MHMPKQIVLNSTPAFTNLMDVAIDVIYMVNSFRSWRMSVHEPFRRGLSHTVGARSATFM